MPFFSFFCTRTKDQRRDQTTKKVDSSYDLMIFSSYSHAHSPETQSRGGRRQRRRRRRRRRERNNSALYSYIVLLIFLNRYHRLSVVVFYDSVKARTFFSSVAPKVTYSFVPFSTQNSTTTRTTTNKQQTVMKKKTGGERSLNGFETLSSSFSSSFSSRRLLGGVLFDGERNEGEREGERKNSSTCYRPRFSRASPSA